LPKRLEKLEERNEVQATIDRLSKPAPAKLLLERVATTLMQYYVADVGAVAARNVAEDYREELKTYPVWAVRRACRWWLSVKNEERRRRPLPGDIAARVLEEMRPVRGAICKVMAFDRGELPEAPPVEISAEDQERRRAFAENLIAPLRRKS